MFDSRERRMDRRADPRFNLNVPVQFTWKIPGVGPELGNGKTRDVSLRGVFVFADVCPPAGSAVRVNVLLPSGAGDSNLVMRARATVVRVESTEVSESGAGFAAVTKRYLLEKYHEELNDEA
jgi:hypothetical protein